MTPQKAISILKDAGLTNYQIELFVRSLGFGIPAHSLTDKHWLQVIEELNSIEFEGLLTTYLNYIQKEDSYHTAIESSDYIHDK